MTEGRLLLALLLPWLAGGLVLRAMRSDRGWLEHVAGGWFLGQLLVVGWLFLLLRGGASVGLWSAVLPIAAAAAAAAWWCARQPPTTGRTQTSLHAPHASLAVWIAAAVILLSLAIKAAIVTAAIGGSPIRHDDALAIWLFRAKAIAGLGHLPLNPADPLYLGGTHADYPLFASLVPAWVAIVAGEWREAWVTLPWLGFYLNLPLMIAANLSRWMHWTRAGLTAYAVASLPLLVVHAMRPGYADMLLAGFLAAATLSALDAFHSGSARAIVLACVFGIGAAWMKREGLAAFGVVVAALMVPAIAAAHGRTAGLLRTFAVGGVVSTAAIWVGMDLTFMRDTFEGAGIHGDVWPVLGRHLGTWGSFGLFWYAVALGLVWRIASLWRHRTNVSPAIFCILLTAYGAAIFLCTDNARFAYNDQTPSRVFLQLSPAVAAAIAAAVWGRPTEASVSSGDHARV
jgi:hypothetical protein